jgi:hypothetical protein
MKHSKTIGLLENSLKAQFQDGMRKAVLIVGSGLHAKLNLNGTGSFQDWACLVKTICDKFGVERKSKHPDLTSAWEALILETMIEGGATADLAAHEMERILLQEVCGLLEKQRYESNSKLDRLAKELFQKHRDIVSLNFDRTIDRAISPTSGQVRVGGSPATRIGPQARKTLHVKLPRQRVWHPHGIAQSKTTARSIQLGVRAYAQSAQLVNEAIVNFRKKQREWLSSHGYIPGAWTREKHDRWDEQLRGLRTSKPLSWVDVCMTSDLIFVGCGLNRAELDLWILLHERQRQFARRSDNVKPRTFLLHETPEKCTGDNSDLAYILNHRPAGIVPVGFKTYEDMWSFLLKQR